MNDASMSFLAIFPSLLGGVGLFLAGMILMSDGLKAAAGGRLQWFLERTTHTPLSAFLTGVALTALVQSSSATTITTIGFVSAGLLSFSSAIGVIIGANVGTTSTGWIVALLGFKLNVGAIALPFIGVGALMRLLLHGARASLGMALVGFGLIFVGIDFLQEGMGGLAHHIDLSPFSQPSLMNHLWLVLIGAVMTVLLQSSSAAVALTLTALNSGAIGLEQSAYLVIGQNLGTTVKAILAAMGASMPAQRTALAHILFNGVTGALTFFFAPMLLALAIAWSEFIGDSDPSVVIALFHTLFNLLGAALFLPFITPFARLIERLIPERGPVLTRHLDDSVLHLPEVATEAAARALTEIAAVALKEAVHLLHNGALDRAGEHRLHLAQTAMDETSRFLGRIQYAGYDGEIFARRLALLHAGDHADRLIEACLESPSPLYGEEVRTAAAQLAEALAPALDWLETRKGDASTLVQRLAQASTRQAEARRLQREQVLLETAAGRIQPDEAQRRLESMRWVDRVGYHAWRMMHHLTGSPSAAETLQTAAYAEPEPISASTNP
ncbi:Na/Pi cotransporter family protein [Caldilinea sp.]|jgi:phosphate:Na+ symporter|uniref:Na/Pi cotransporter family protein n=1 Tax=Caldilinea sp. TaxID=2293560 RepID=UPI0026167A28|nr:Na/Pi symporter [uncultured Caldilinea sp.]